METEEKLTQVQAAEPAKVDGAAAKREPQIPDTPAESMEDYKEAIDKSFGHSYEWDKLAEYKEQKTNLRVKIEETTKGGVLTHIEGMRAFIPASKLAINYVEEAELPSYVGKEMEVRVITAERQGEKLVCSARDILWDAERAARRAKIEQTQVGSVLTGKVESLQPYGAFIDLGDGMSGLVHVSQISHKRVENPASVLKKGDEVKVKVIAVKDGKLSLSIKALDEKAAEEQKEKDELENLPHEYTSGGSVGDLLKKAGF